MSLAVNFLKVVLLVVVIRMILILVVNLLLLAELSTKLGIDIWHKNPDKVGSDSKLDLRNDIVHNYLLI
jgi:hypothetical protein